MSNQNGTANVNPGANAQDNDKINVEELAKKFNDLQAELEAERKSKERILNESKEWKEKAQSYRSKEEEFKSQQAKLEEDKLREQGQYKTLLEQREQRLKELEESLNEAKGETENYRKSILNLKKASAFEREIGGKLRKDSYWSHVDFDSIAIDPETNQIDKTSLKSVADNFIKEYKELVAFPNNANLPNGTPTGGKGRLSYEQWKALPLKERKARMKDVVQ